MQRNLHLKTKLKKVITINKASYKSKFVFNLRQRSPKDIIKYFISLDIKKTIVKSRSPLQNFREKYK